MELTISQSNGVVSSVYKNKQTSKNKQTNNNNNNSDHQKDRS